MDAAFPSDSGAIAPFPPASATLAPEPMSQALRAALLESRQRWRDFVTLAADLVFETDAEGRLVFLAPDPVLGWPVVLWSSTGSRLVPLAVVAPL